MSMDNYTKDMLAEVARLALAGDCTHPAIRAALAVMNSPDPPWPKDLTETIASFLGPVDALALDASGRATRCVTMEYEEILLPVHSGSRDVYHAHRWFDVTMPVRGRLHTAGITFTWADQGWGAQKGMLSVVRESGRAPNDYEGWSADVMCGKEPAPHESTSDSMEFCPRAGEEYAVWYRVGGGGGHELYMDDIGVHRLRYR